MCGTSIALDSALLVCSKMGRLFGDRFGIIGLDLANARPCGSNALPTLLEGTSLLILLCVLSHEDHEGRALCTRGSKANRWFVGWRRK